MRASHRSLHFLTYSLLGFLMLQAVGCAPPPADDADRTLQVDHMDSTMHTGTAKPLLELDNGERWAMSPSMLPPVRRMQERITDAAQAGILDHTALADSLFVDLDALVAGCTMEGRAHEELHDWLMPHMQLVQELEKSTDTAQARTILMELAHSSAEFDRYFE